VEAFVSRPRQSAAETRPSTCAREALRQGAGSELIHESPSEGNTPKENAMLCPEEIFHDMLKKA